MENTSDWKKRIKYNPEDDLLFNSSRLLILFEVLDELKFSDGIDMERLSYYDFFAANPFLIFEKDDPVYFELELIGFESNKLEYLSTAQLYRTKRASIKQYLAYLVCKNLIKLENIDGRIVFKITELGLDMSKGLISLYALAYRASLSIVVQKLKKYSDKKLWENASIWLESKTFQIDLYDGVSDFE